MIFEPIDSNDFGRSDLVMNRDFLKSGIIVNHRDTRMIHRFIRAEKRRYIRNPGSHSSGFDGEIIEISRRKMKCAFHFPICRKIYRILIDFDEQKTPF